MTFPPNIERWRTKVEEITHVLFVDVPACRSLVESLGITPDSLQDAILGIIKKRSLGEPRTKGNNGKSVGLMLLNYEDGVPQSVGFNGTKQELYDPSTNIYYGAKYLLTKLHIHGDIEKAVNDFSN